MACCALQSTVWSKSASDQRGLMGSIQKSVTEMAQEAKQKGEKAWLSSPMAQYMEQKFKELEKYIAQKDREMTLKLETAIENKIEQVKNEIIAHYEHKAVHGAEHAADLAVNPVAGTKAAVHVVGDIAHHIPDPF